MLSMYVKVITALLLIASAAGRHMEDLEKELDQNMQNRNLDSEDAELEVKWICLKIFMWILSKDFWLLFQSF